MDVRKIPIHAIRIKERAREEYGNLDELAASIKEKGLIQPITIDKSLRLLAGERRLKACIKAGFTEIDAVVRDIHPEDPEIDSKEIELYENIHRKDFEWTEKIALQKEIHDLYQAKHLEGWSQRDTAKLLDISQGQVSQNIMLAEAVKAIPELGKEKTEADAMKKFNNLRKELARAELGRRQQDKQFHKWASESFKVGDAVEGLKARRQCNVGFAEVDPPYGIRLDEKKLGDSVEQKGYTEIDSIEYPGFVMEVAKEVYRILDTDAFCVWWFGPTWFHMVKHTLIEVGFSVSELPGIWFHGAQGQTRSPNSNLASGYEMFFVARKGSPTLAKPGRLNVFHYAPLSPGKKIHPTEKPIELLEEMLDTFCQPGSIVCSPFLGSGVTLRASFKKNHPAFGWDVSEEAKAKFLHKVSEEFGEEG